MSNIITQIKSLKERNSKAGRLLFHFKLEGLKLTFANYVSQIDNFFEKEELLKYFVVSCISTMESFFRDAYKDIIDSGEPHISNARKLEEQKAFRLSFDILVEIQGRKLTAGDFISHSIPCSSLNDINKFSTILIGKEKLDGADFIEAIKKVDFKRLPTKQKDFDFPKIFSDVSRAFELRHIICHEWGNDLGLTVDKVQSILDSTGKFLLLAEEKVFTLLYPDLPDSHVDWLNRASQQLKDLEETLETKLTALKGMLPEDYLKTFDESQRGWELYVDGHVGMSSEIRACGGTIYSDFLIGTRLAKVEDRISEIDEMIESIDDFLDFKKRISQSQED